MNQHRERLIAIVLLCLAVSACTNAEHRTIFVVIDQNGETVFHGSWKLPDNMPVAKVWGEIGSVPFITSTFLDDPESIDDRTHANLDGNVVVRIESFNKGLDGLEELASVSLDSLSIERENVTDITWSLSAGEAERVKQAATD